MTQDSGTTFELRLSFGHPRPGFFRFEQEVKSIELPDGQTLSLVARDAQKLIDATRFHFAMSGFPDAASAQARGDQLWVHLQVLNASLALGLQVPPTDTTSARMADEPKKKLAKEHGVTLVDSIVGVGILPDDGNHAELIVSGVLDVYPSDPEYVLDALKTLWPIELKLSDRQRDALEILGRATSELSPRTRFLLSYLALERMVKRESRSPAAQALLKSFITQAADSLPDGESQSLAGALAALSMQSFASALRELAIKVREPKEIDGRSVGEFLSDCVRARNAIAHDSNSEASDHLVHLTTHLQRFVLTLVWTEGKHPPVSFKVPPSSVGVPTLKIFVK